MELSLASVAVIGIFLFLLFMFLRMPIGVAMLLSGFIGIWLIRGLPPALSATGITLYRIASSHGLSVIPLFILMGILAGTGGVSKDAFSTLNKWLGHNAEKKTEHNGYVLKPVSQEELLLTVEIAL